MVAVCPARQGFAGALGASGAHGLSIGRATGFGGR